MVPASSGDTTLVNHLGDNGASLGTRSVSSCSKLGQDQSSNGTNGEYSDFTIGGLAMDGVEETLPGNIEILQESMVVEDVVKGSEKDHGLKVTEHNMIEKNSEIKDANLTKGKGSVPLSGAKSRKKMVAALASPRRKLPPKAGLGEKDVGKDKNGKVALPKLPA